MESPAKPEDELSRIESLCRLNVLDTPSEERFDRITRIAQRHFNVPIALVSLIDSERQWFKSRQGLDAVETSREISFCGHTILSDSIFYIPNALEDGRFADNPLVTGPPNIRFYAGAPLLSPDGARVGTLCLIDSEVRQFTPTEFMVLRDLADIVEEELGRVSLLKVQNELDLTSKYYQSIIESSEDAIIGKNLDGIITSWNPAAEKMFGYSEDEVIGQPALMLMERDNYREEQDILSQISEGISIEYFGTIRRHKNGSLIDVEVSISPISDLQGKVIGASTIARDVTRSKQVESKLRDSETRIRTIVESVVDGIITIDSRGVVQTINAAAEKIFGYSTEEVIGHNVKMLMPEAYSKEHDEYISNYLTTGVKKIIGIGREVEGKRKDGSTFPMELAVSNMMINGEYMFAGVVRDITERKKMERMKSEFVSTVSHELRTPLTSIRGALGLVLGKYSDQLPDGVRKMVEMANRNSERLTILINDILDLEKIEAEHLKFNFKVVNLAHLAKMAIDDNQGFARAHGVELAITHSLSQAMIWGDESRLLQVFANLISNAVKFSPPGGVVELSLAAHQGAFQVSVRDYGEGIPLAFRSQLFQRFAQADSSDAREKGGTGLGLNICKAILERHKGTIDYQSTVGEGTVFSFILPNVAAQPDFDASKEASANVLICENDEDVAEVLAQLVKQEGFSCDIAETAEIAEDFLGKYHYQLLLLDLHLPGIGGLELIQKLRMAPNTACLPIIVVSAHAESNQSNLAGGALLVADWLEKPFDEKRLLQSVKNVLHTVKQPRILHIEDDIDIVHMTQNLVGSNAEFYSTSSLYGARQLLAENSFDLIILDLELVDGSGVDMLAELKNYCPIVIFSAQVPHQVANQVEEVMIKSMTTNEQLKQTIHKLLNQHVSRIKNGH